MSNGSVLITTDVHPLIFDGLKELNYDYDYNPTIKNEAVRKIVQKYTGMLISTSTIVDREMLDAASRLKFIGRAGSGMEIIDLDYAESKGVHCFNSPEGNRDAVAEHAVGMLLSLMHRIKIADFEVQNGFWNREKNRGEELMHLTVGLLGYGNTGSAMARKLSGFQVKTVAYDKYKKNFGSDIVEEVSIEEIFKRADILSIHLPLTEETKYWVDEKFLRKFEKPIYLLNTARGKNLRTADLIPLLKEGKVKGAALDVLENEQLDRLTDTEKQTLKKLIEMENVIITPHIAGWTSESKEKIAKKLLEKIHLIT